MQRSVSRAEARRIVLDIYERFFTREECRRILREIARQRETGKYHKFWVDLKDSPLPGELDDADLDEYLGYFELLGALVRRRTVFFEDVNDLFGYYVEAAWEHPSIREYVEEIRRESGDPTAYEHFQYLAGRVAARTEADVRRGEGGRVRHFVYGAVAFAAAAAVAGWLVGWGVGRVIQTVLNSSPELLPQGAAAASAGLGLITQVFILTFLWHREREAGFAIYVSRTKSEKASRHTAIR
ncbi:hypothetical protein Adeg_1348 [Ammonifex degensii KC4]|uniref:Uncharacterized protein n=1 Tax=Ammonifex degensii (strain DSM 10501 / KC4) TaxID=429009 RepID=C9R824_AMMDK|nr:hypothetical protein Adeg_1348 [Ammonifex degensii KC4]